MIDDYDGELAADGVRDEDVTVAGVVNDDADDVVVVVVLPDVEMMAWILSLKYFGAGHASATHSMQARCTRSMSSRASSGRAR